MDKERAWAARLRRVLKAKPTSLSLIVVDNAICVIPRNKDGTFLKRPFRSTDILESISVPGLDSYDALW